MTNRQLLQHGDEMQQTAQAKLTTACNIGKVDEIATAYKNLESILNRQLKLAKTIVEGR